MKPTRRSLLRASGWGGLLGFLPAAAAQAAPARRDVYRELGLRPVLNFKGAHTVIGASKQAADFSGIALHVCLAHVKTAR